jgi:hypothetical protein
MSKLDQTKYADTNAIIDAYEKHNIGTYRMEQRLTIDEDSDTCNLILSLNLGGSATISFARDNPKRLAFHLYGVMIDGDVAEVALTTQDIAALSNVLQYVEVLRSLAIKTFKWQDMKEDKYLDAAPSLNAAAPQLLEAVRAAVRVLKVTETNDNESFQVVNGHDTGLSAPIADVLQSALDVASGSKS